MMSTPPTNSASPDPTRLLHSQNVTLPFPTLSPDCISSLKSSPGSSAIDLPDTHDHTRTRTSSYPLLRPHSPVPTRSVLLSPASTGLNSSPTPSVILTSHHHHDRAPSPALMPSSPPVSFPPRPMKQYSYSHHNLPDQQPCLPGDATPPNGVPRRWWWSRSSSRERGSSVSPSRGRSVSPAGSIPRNSVVPFPRLDENFLFTMDDDVQQDIPLPPLSSGLLSLSGESIQIRDLNDRNLGDEHGNTELQESLLLSSPEHIPATLVPPTPPTSHERTLKSLGVGIGEDVRKGEIERSFWPDLLGRSPRSSPKSPNSELSISGPPIKSLEDHIISMENWDGKSLQVVPLSPEVISASLSSPKKIVMPKSPSKTVSPTSLGKPPSTLPGKGREDVQDTFPKEPFVYRNLTANMIRFPHWHRDSTKGEKGKEREGWLRARENVSLALNAVLPTSELVRLSEAGEGFAKEGEAARAMADSAEGEEVAKAEDTQAMGVGVGTGEKLWWTVKSTVTSVSPLLRTSLTILGDVSKLTPIPGLHEAARILLAVWEAVDTVETNRIQCLRLTERCATAIFSVRAEIADAERDMQSQHGTLEDNGLAKEMERPVRKLNECVGMVYDFLLKLNRRPFIKRFLRSDEIIQEIQACDRALGDAMQMFSISIQIRLLNEFKRFARERHQLDAEHQVQMQGGLTPLPLYSSPPTQTLPTLLEYTPRVGALEALPELQDILPETSGLSRSRPVQDPTLSVAQSTTDTNPDSTSNVSSLSPLAELNHLLTAENVSDMEHDRTLFYQTLQSGIGARSDAEMLRVLQVSPGEAPEALKALRRAEALSEETETSAEQGATAIGGLERQFMESGIEALTRLSSVAVQKADGQDVDVPWDLPPWTITRYEADRVTMIGSGSFSKVYLGSWSGQRVAIKVLSSYTPKSLFKKEVEIWRKLRHDNVLKMWGASSTQGERPWFIVSEYCEGGSLVGWLTKRKVDDSGAVGTLNPPSANTKGDVDLLRCMHHISMGMMYLHDENVLHGDLKAANVLVDDRGRCVISDFGQSEMKLEVSRKSGIPITTHGTLPWQAPELLNGATKLTPAMDVYAFSICCVEILGMGDLPYGYRDDNLVALLVLEQDKRAEIPSTSFTPLVAALIQECWVRDPAQRPTFKHVAATLKRLRKRQGAVESPRTVQPKLALDSHAWSHPHSSSPSMRPKELPETPVTASEGIHVAPGISEARQVGDPVSADAESTSATSCDIQPSQPCGSPCNNPSHRHWEPIVNSDTGVMEMPSAGCSMTVIYTPSLHSSMEDSDASSFTSSHHMSSPEAEPIKLEHRTHRVGSGYESALPMDEHVAEKRNEYRFRSLAQSTHRFHHSLTLPLWSPSHIELGAVGYLSKPKGQFITLFNAMHPQRTAGSKIMNIPSLGGYGSIRTGKKFDSKLTVTQKGRDLFSGLLTFGLTNDGTHSEHISRRHEFPLRAGHKTAYICAESTMYQFIEDLTAPKEWFKANVKSVLKEYAPRHPIQKEDIIVVVGTLSAPEYALFVSHSHPNGQAYFNVFSDRKNGRQWGTFTTDNEYPSDEGGPSYIEEIPSQAMFSSKVSPVRLNAKSDDKDWDTLMLARLRFLTDATEPTSQ